MNTLPYTDALAELAGQSLPQITLIFDHVPTTAPVQRARLMDWLDQCARREAVANSEKGLTGAVRDLVTLRNGQLTFTADQSQTSGDRKALVLGDLGGAVALGQLVIALLYCVAEHDPELAMRLIREAQTTDVRQRGEIARMIG